MTYINTSTSLFNLDASESAYLLRELEQIKNREIDTVYNVSKLFKFIPIDSTTNPGAQSTSYKVYDKQHNAEILSEGANDIPVVNLTAKEVAYSFRNIATSYLLTIDMVKAAAFSGRSLEPRFLDTCYDSIMRKMDRLGWFGDAKHGIPGWLSNPNVDKKDVAGADAAAKKWFDADGVAVKTADQIIADVNEMLDFAFVNSGGSEEVSTVIFPLKHYRYIQNKMRNDHNAETVLEILQGQYPNVTFDWANELTAVAAFGNKNGMVAYARNPVKIYQEIPEMFEQLAPQLIDTNVKVICLGRYGGVHIPFPLSCVFRTGI